MVTPVAVSPGGGARPPRDGRPHHGRHERTDRTDDRWFFPCDHAFHRTLACLYDSDPRYAQAYDGAHPGLSAYVTAAIRANADGAASAG